MRLAHGLPSFSRVGLPDGAAFDLPIALGILAATKTVKKTALKSFLILGELSLYGEVKPVKGTLQVSIVAREDRPKGVIISGENANEAAMDGCIERILNDLTKVKGWI